MYQRLLCLCLACFPCLAFSQIEKVYDDKEHLRTVNPISEAGIYEGVGYSWHPNGAIARETPYAEGYMHGLEKGYFPDGNLQFTQEYHYGDRVGRYIEFFADGNLKMYQQWEEGFRSGETIVYNERGGYRMYGLYEGDSLLFAQYFDRQGNILRERYNGITTPLDTSEFEDPIFLRPEQAPLQAGVSNPCNIVLPKVPSHYIAYSCPDGIITYDPEGGLFPYQITPHSGLDVCRLYLRIKTHDHGGFVLMRRMLLQLN